MLSDSSALRMPRTFNFEDKRGLERQRLHSCIDPQPNFRVVPYLLLDVNLFLRKLRKQDLHSSGTTGGRVSRNFSTTRSPEAKDVSFKL